MQKALYYYDYARTPCHVADCVQGKQLFAETSGGTTSRARLGKKGAHNSNENSGVSARTRAQTKRETSKHRLVSYS